MSTPQGFNPIGESAPGLPRHDASLPGHVPGSYAPDPGQQQTWAPNRGGSYFPGAIWAARGFVVLFIYLTLPVQLALYPIAGAPGLLCGWVTFRTFHGMGIGYDDAMSWAWTVGIIAFLPIMRVEIAAETRFPRYRSMRHWLRLVLLAALIYYLMVVDRPDDAILATVVTVVLSHFLLRAGFTRGFWHAFQGMIWLPRS